MGPNWRKAIDSWFNEIDGFPSSSVSNYKFNHKTGHYSQLVWAKTSRIGCGSIAYRLDSAEWWLSVDSSHLVIPDHESST